MDKPTAPPQHRRYPRSSAAPPPAAIPAPPAAPVVARAIERRWPRSVPERRVFPRG